MRFGLVLCLALCVSSVFSDETNNKLEIMKDALRKIISKTPFANLPKIEAPIKSWHFIASTPLELAKFTEVLVKNGLTTEIAEALAAKTISKIQSEEDRSFRLTDSEWTKIESETYQFAQCIYKKSSPESRDLFCLAANLRISDEVLRKASNIRDFALRAFEETISRLPKWLPKYHSFTRLSLPQFHSLKSGKTQSQLDQLLRSAVGSKEAIVYELNQNKNDPFLAKLFKNGITSYTSSAIVESLEGVDAGMINEYAEHLSNSMGIPFGARATFKDQLFLSTLTEKNEWKELEFMFKVNQGTAKYISVMSVLDESTNTLDFLNSDIKAGFELGPDVIISTKTRSSFFGLFSRTTIEITKRPAELTMRSIELLFKFFKVAAYDKFRAFRRV